jgi:hypothetical protein
MYTSIHNLFKGRTRFRTVLISVRNRTHFKAYDSVRFVPKILV